MHTSFFQTKGLFTGISAISLDKLSQFAKRHFYKRNTIIFGQSKTRSTFLYVLKGQIKLFKENASGEEIIIDILSQEEYAGETFLFQGDKWPSYTVESITDVEILTLPCKLLKALVLDDHKLALNLLNASLQKQQKLSMELEHLSILNASQRIACFILQLQNNVENKNTKLNLPYDKTLIASRLGMRPETFSRALHTLSKQCDVTIHGNTIKIADFNKLEHYVCHRCSVSFLCNTSYKT